MIRYISKVDPRELAGIALLRLDFNTEDEWRMRAVLPTVKYLLKYAHNIVILSHKGRPAGIDRKFSLRANAKDLERFLRRRVIFIPHFRFVEMRRQVERAPRGSIFLLENMRFNPEEDRNDETFAKQLASLADYYVNDAFAVSHRANASVEAVTRFLPSYAGLELENEIRHLSSVMKKPKQPLIFIIGGAKAHEKLGIINCFKNKAKAFLLGGACANTMLCLAGVDVKKSVRDTDPKDLESFRKVMECKNVIYPVDWVISDEKIVDIGPGTVKRYTRVLSKARTIVWSGPMGLIEDKRFVKANLAIAKAIVSNKKAFSVTGGGETVMFLKQHKLDKKFGFISTGGGALTEYLEGKKLPGLEALKNYSN